MTAAFWPGRTAEPQPAGTHRVVRRDHDTPTVPTYLMPAGGGPDAAPRWSAYPSDAGLWPLAEAHDLAELHARAAEAGGVAAAITVERRKPR